ncbi:DUF3221 domain-containing protein [Metabacillus malikii]|uniref:DUF3221 domain-containing protein n=1 Tax=Metabacillus malikii TaxID=1504265 RepID=A0ABT9ZA98_9BACI|nr:DUF3221 domain-containing protein [Metabacillus malikii]MDQ0229181.1 hypothetical protein [Metabacillus malikii]
MKIIFKALAFIFLLTIVGCATSPNSSEDKNNENKTESSSFIGTIKEINGDGAIVSAKVFEGNPEGDVFVDLSVNSDEVFQVGDKVKVGFDGTIRESYPAQINTLFVELVD